MRVWTLPIMVLMLALTVSGCGQKGPLYRDSQDISAKVVSGAPDDEKRE